MSPESYSAIASAISAGCALFTLYMFRSQGKGFVWTKDHKANLIPEEKDRVHMQIEVPLYNFGKGNIKFLKLKAKKINLKTKAMENFELDMDEAYFPEGASIITYRTGIDTDMNKDEKSKFILAQTALPSTTRARKEFTDKINQKINNIPEHIVILKCLYKDGSWFGNRTKETVIGLSITSEGINFLSTARRKELNEYFSW